MRVQGRVLILIAVLSGTVRDSAEGQDQPTDCQQVVQNIKARVTLQRYVDALRDLRDECPSTAAEVLIQQWRNPPIDSLLFTVLVEATAKVRAREVTEALLAVASSEAAPRDRRFGAVQALATHFSPCLTIQFVGATMWGTQPRIGVLIGRLPDVDPAERAQPGVPEFILQRLDELSRTSSDVIFREAARKAAFRFRLVAKSSDRSC